MHHLTRSTALFYIHPQKDIRERNRQVAEMGRIYSSAAEVVIWLGDEAPGSDLVMPFLCRFKDKKYAKLAKTDVKELLGSVPNAKQRVKSFLQDRYWARAWIIQEIVLARKARVHCGASSVPLAVFEDFLRYARALQNLQILLLGIRDTFFKLVEDRYDMVALLRQVRETKGLTLGDIITSCGTAEATDSRDKIFGILGLVTRGTGRFLTPGYGMSECQVYREAIQIMCEDHDRGKDAFASLLIGCISRTGQAVPDRAYRHHPKDFLNTDFSMLEPSDALEVGSCDGRLCGTLWTCFKTPELLERKDDMWIEMDTS